MTPIQLDTQGRSMIVRGTLPAPIDLVWAVWTSTEHIEQWWGPDGFSTIIHQMDLYQGGEWKLTLQGLDGKHYPNKSIFTEIIPKQKIAFQHFNPHYLAEIFFSPDKDFTHMEWSSTFETDELFETVVRVFKADTGLKQNALKLINYLQTQLKA
jgi:uncharacterized protein YndB with AHSA1/START domain